MIKLKQFRLFLEKSDYSKKTVEAYYSAMKYYSRFFSKTDMTSMMAYKAMLIERCRPQTVNLRLRALNCYNETMGIEGHMVFVKVQRSTFLDNVISQADYKHLWKALERDGYHDWSMLIRFLGSTGARISEALQFKSEHIHAGHIDIYSKGGKIRRIYIPKALRTDAEKWINDNDIEGLLFRWSDASVRGRLKDFARKYSIDETVMHPHSFRHLFGKSFISKYKDIALLADLMGHDSIETTRIYLMRTSAEQAAIVDRVVTW